jgi:hypothetical protein
MNEALYKKELSDLVENIFIPLGYKLTGDIEIDPIAENLKYSAMNLGINYKRVFYREAKITPDRPGAFVTLWQRPSSSSINNNKPTPIESDQLDYLFVRVQDGIFIFPTTVLVEKKIFLLRI